MAGGAISEESRDGRCAHCERPVRADLGVENSIGQVLCGACFEVLGPRAGKRVTRERIDSLKRATTR